MASDRPEAVAPFLTNLFSDYRNGLWGRWRPSAEAMRRGPIGIRLEELLYRDRVPLREAVQFLRSSGATMGEPELVRLAAKLPQRHPVREVGIDELEAAETETLIQPAGPSADDREGARALAEVLHSLVEQLEPEDALILRMRYWNGVSVAYIARALRIEQKPLYPRLSSIETQLREQLAAQGIDRERAAEFLAVGDDAW